VHNSIIGCSEDHADAEMKVTCKSCLVHVNLFTRSIIYLLARSINHHHSITTRSFICSFVHSLICLFTRARRLPLHRPAQSVKLTMVLRLRLHPLHRPAQATTTAVQFFLHVNVKLMMMLRLRLRLLHRPVLRLRLLQGRLPRHPVHESGAVSMTLMRSFHIGPKASFPHSGTSWGRTAK
jgi:hypothetical protein